MIVAAILLGYALLLALAGPALLAGARWPERAPRLAIALWQALSVAVLTATVLAGVAVAVPTGLFSGSLAGWLRACLMAIRDGYATGGGAALAVTGLLTAAVVASRAAGCLAAGMVVARRQRRAHADALTLLACRALDRETVVIEHAAAAAYCVPGRRRRVVLTSAAVDALDTEELRAVLAHERAHLSGRHHLVLAFADAMRRAFPGVPVFRRAHDEITRLVEMAADDIASRQHGRLTVASAMAALVGAGAPAAALAAGGSSALTRARRLLAPASPLRMRTVLAGGALALVVAALPTAVAAAPAFAATRMAPCTGTHQMLGGGAAR